MTHYEFLRNRIAIKDRFINELQDKIEELEKKLVIANKRLDEIDV